MGRVKSKNLPVISGSLSYLIFYEVNGQQLVRTKPGRYRDAQSTKQLVQRQRLSATQQFLRCFRPIIKRCYTHVAPGKTAYGEAVTWHMQNALGGDYPHIAIEPAKALLTRGTLDTPAPMSVVRDGDSLLLQWAVPAPQNGSGTDVLQLVVLPVGNAEALELNPMAQRAQQTARAQIGWGGTRAHVWAYFLDIRNGEVSNSVYVGTC